MAEWTVGKSKKVDNDIFTDAGILRKAGGVWDGKPLKFSMPGRKRGFKFQINKDKVSKKFKRIRDDVLQADFEKMANDKVLPKLNKYVPLEGGRMQDTAFADVAIPGAGSEKLSIRYVWDPVATEGRTYPYRYGKRVSKMDKSQINKAYNPLARPDWGSYGMWRHRVFIENEFKRTLSAALKRGKK